MTHWVDQLKETIPDYAIKRLCSKQYSTKNLIMLIPYIYWVDNTTQLRV